MAERRIRSLDIVRGAVMVLMALDHVRVFSGIPAGGATPGIFFTRWVTHFCAPAFFFLAGTGAFLYGRKVARTELARFLVIRGALLILLELTLIRFSWTFNFDYQHYLLAGVIWALGWCMISLAGLVFLPFTAIAVLGVAIICGHNLLDALPAVSEKLGASLGGWWNVLYIAFYGDPIQVAGTQLIVLYSIVPWIGVMAAGYAFGRVMTLAPDRRRRVCLAIGGGAILLFIVLRALDLYGDPAPWLAASRDGKPALLRVLNTTKYPASLLFLLMTLGPTIALLPFLENARGRLANLLTVYGRVPFFYYLLHIPLIHVVALGISLIRDGAVSPWLYTNHPMANPRPPEGYAWSLPLLYAVTAAVVALLYLPCRWLAALKERRKDAWLRYL